MCRFLHAPRGAFLLRLLQKARSCRSRSSTPRNCYLAPPNAARNRNLSLQLFARDAACVLQVNLCSRRGSSSSWREQQCLWDNLERTRVSASTCCGAPSSSSARGRHRPIRTGDRRQRGPRNRRPRSLWGLQTAPSGRLLGSELRAQRRTDRPEVSQLMSELHICESPPYGARPATRRSAGRASASNSPREIGTATFSINVNTKNPSAKIPAATRSSVSVGAYS